MAFFIFIWKKKLYQNRTQIGSICFPSFFPTTVQDFPIRGHQVFLHIKRRRWLNTKTGKVVRRDWTLVAKGTRMTSEFAIFYRSADRNTTVDTNPNDVKAIAGFYGMSGKGLLRHYRDFQSGFK